MGEIAEDENCFTRHCTVMLHQYTSKAVKAPSVGLLEKKNPQQQSIHTVGIDLDFY